MHDITENELKKHDFWFVGTKSNPKLMVYETASNLLWLPVSVQELFNRAQSISKIKTNPSPIGEPTNWRLPTPLEIKEFASRSNNPLGQKTKLLGFYRWITQSGSLHLSNDTLSTAGTGHILACSEILRGKHLTDILWLVQSKAMQITSAKTAKPIQLSDEQFLAITEKRINNKAARDAELNKMLNQLMENTVGDYCNEYLRNISVMNARFNQLSELAALNSTTKSEK